MPSAKQAHAAHAVRCDGCGAAIPIQGLTSTASCPHCSHTQQLDPKLVRSLAGYQHAVQNEVALASAELHRAARSEAQHAAIKTPAIQYLLGFGLMMGLPLVFIISGVIVMKLGVVDERTGGPILGIGAVLAGGVGAVLYGLSSFLLAKSRARRAVALPSATITCPSCGAANPIAPGAAVGRCEFCGAALMPSETAVKFVADAARSAARTAVLERMRQERELVAGYHAYSIQGNTILIMAGAPMTLVLGITAVGFTYEMATGAEPFNPSIIVVWALFFALAIGMTAGTAYVLYKRNVFHKALASLIAAYAGRDLGNLGGTVWWLNKYWAGPYPNDKLAASAPYGSVALVVGGFHCLVEFAPSTERHCRPRLHILVAAWLPGLSDGMGRPPPADEQLRRAHQALFSQGFEGEQNAGGLFLWADRATLKAFRKDPERLAQLGPTLTQAVLVTRGLGGEPV